MAAAAKPESTAVATTPKREITISDLPALIRDSTTARQTIAPFLPEGVSLDRVAASLKVALAKDRAAWKKEGPSPLERCSPMSVFMAAAKICQWGLEIGETAHLVPFGSECTPVADYKGLAELVIASGMVRHVQAHCVYEKEPFQLRLGTSTSIEHHPIGDPKARGAMIGAYALFHLRGYLTSVKYMSVDEIEAIRKRYSKQWKEGALPAWYAEKTCVRQGVKLLPKNPRLAKLLSTLDEIDAEEPAGIPEALQALAGEISGTASHTLPDDNHGRPRALGRVPRDDAYGMEGMPEPPAKHSDDPAARAEDFEEPPFQDDRDLMD